MGSEFAYYASQIVSDIIISASPIIEHFSGGFLQFASVHVFSADVAHKCLYNRREGFCEFTFGFLMVPKEDHEFFKLWFVGLQT